ncbi:uncharacterized protein N7487_005464 [Penicillium crustosum]|uniref:uncharacterized protein n=1 Tax=Penicillium crustosum TaxID=36656 RepID=UPI00238777C2|nr:uncharacterized protein N7487_005464 [Penicillium crustosum]KAJ5411105.1 hypothetical protein N7487_005464 [Penicillium crustosum]
MSRTISHAYYWCGAIENFQWGVRGRGVPSILNFRIEVRDAVLVYVTQEDSTPEMFAAVVNPGYDNF